jgi:acyl carrier protein
MELDNFVKNFTDQFEETDSHIIQAGTKFRDLEEWSSLIAMSIIAMVDEAYNVKLTGDDIRKSITIEDIFNIVKSRV